MKKRFSEELIIGFIERFNDSFRRGVLDMYLFRTLSAVRDKADLPRHA